jgi:hypothetical protein
MFTREAAVEAKQAMTEYKSGGLALRVSFFSNFVSPQLEAYFARTIH